MNRMNGTLLFFIFIAFMAIIFAAKIAKLSPDVKKYKYKKINNLLTAAEISFLGVLDMAINDNQRVFCKVRMADLVSVHATKKNWYAGFNRIKAKHLDFVICNKATGEVLGVIELNDKSHERKDRLERDILVKSICEEAGLPIKFIRCKRAYQVEEIKQTIENLLEPEINIKNNVKAESRIKVINTKDEILQCCIKCGNKAVMLKDKKYWVCNNFPKCITKN